MLVEVDLNGSVSCTCIHAALMVELEYNVAHIRVRESVAVNRLLHNVVSVTIQFVGIVKGCEVTLNDIVFLFAVSLLRLADLK